MQANVADFIKRHRHFWNTVLETHALDDMQRMRVHRELTTLNDINEIVHRHDLYEARSEAIHHTKRSFANVQA